MFITCNLLAWSSQCKNSAAFFTGLQIMRNYHIFLLIWKNIFVLLSYNTIILFRGNDFRLLCQLGMIAYLRHNTRTSTLCVQFFQMTFHKIVNLLWCLVGYSTDWKFTGYLKILKLANTYFLFILSKLKHN